ncbi:hypothetical protein ABT144_29325 [Streptomyces sp. NPDC002039]|uniref:hypothetical protein n=1 Tax=Streptomyces sp. NPDC002039 TaxID=3154660 RepID=UPI003316E5E7
MSRDTVDLSGHSTGAHGRWLADHIPGAELRMSPGDGHISVSNAGEDAPEWPAAHWST